jgi:hypothetical protein
VPSSGVQQLIDTAIRGTNIGIVRARVKAYAGTVTVRLRNVTDNVTVGTSDVKTGDWQDADFDVVLTTGSKKYELQVLPSLPDTDVAAIATLE